MKLVCIISILLLSGCAQFMGLPGDDSGWDFDHELQFQQKKVADKLYTIEVRPNKKVNFSKLATFVMRKSMQICKSYGVKIELVQGVESYQHKKSFPNFISESLIVNVECPSNAG